MERRTFTCDGYELAYEVHGEGPRVTVLTNGLLLDAGVNRQLASRLARAGNRVVLLDLLGHGRSAKPRRASAHRIEFYAEHVLALLDHLDVDEAVVGGVSLGAAVSLSVGHRHPDRVRALVVEMPVLENATPFAALLFVPVLLAMHYGGPLARGATGLMGALPRTGVDALDSFMNAASLHPEEITAVLHGILMGSMGPTEDERRRMTLPTLVIGHAGDPLHPATDAARLARQMPSATLVEARSALELRVRPRRLSDEVIRFVDAAWTLRAVDGARTG